MAKSKQERIKYANDELIGKGNSGIIDEIFATDYVAYAGGKKHSGHLFIKRFAEQLRSAIPNIRIVEVKFLTQNNDVIVWQRTLEGTHEADMKGIPSSGKKVEWIDMVVSRFDNEKISEEWVVSELMGELLLKVSRVKKT